MAVLTWDGSGTRFFETGVDHGVVYPMDENGDYPLGIPWNGLSSVSESPSGAEPTKLYADNVVYVTMLSAEEFAATIEAYTYPAEFAVLDGTVSPVPGMSVGQQPRGTFGLVYRTIVGDDVVGEALGYKLHLLYGLRASPSEKAYQTKSDSPEAVMFSWEINSTPAAVSGYQPTSVIVVDSRTADEDCLEALEALLFGTALASAQLPDPDTVIATLTPA